METFASAAKEVLRAFRRGWWWLRQVTGDSSYDNYLRSAARRGSCAHQSLPLSPREFYLDQLRRRYSRPSRCC
jgi:uncharacterized short protein YbdD (DUF466 family)